MSGDADSLTTAQRFHRMIAHTGPITLQQFMGEANARYYAKRDPLGSGGDFVTAPEISQMFGELIGLWLADLWIRAGRPANPLYVELGPGRGTLARDALGAMRHHGLEPAVHLVEGSAALQDRQLNAVPQAVWHHDLASVPQDGPILLVANEFFDALPVRQLVRSGGGWREVMVTSDGTRFALAAGDRPMDNAVPEDRRDAAEGTVIETNPGAAAVMGEIAARLAMQGGCALLVDYGHCEPRSGSTLQAVRAHRKVDPLIDPGEADLTAHVDFHQLAVMAGQHDVRIHGATTQGAFLHQMGIAMRAAALARATPAQAEGIARALARLTAADQMGTLFKVMGLGAPGWPDAAGFAVDT